MTAGRTTGFTDIDQTHWTLRFLPPWARPYGRLARWDRPIGIWLLLFPCWWSLTLAAAPNWGRLAGLMALFALGAIAMRGAGCTWNDIVDRKVDAGVERTRGRPLPSGELKLHHALIWMALQGAVGAAVLFKLNKFAGGVALAPRRWLTLFAVLAIALWTATGVLAPLGPGYFVLLACIAAHLVWQIALLKPGDPADCLMRFKSNRMVGWLLLGALVADKLH